MKLKTLLISSTAVALLAASGVAMAAGNNNLSILSQSGDDNTASIIQNGNNNNVGTEGPPVTRATQNAGSNQLTVNQTSKLAGSSSGNSVDKITQTGFDNDTDPVNLLTIIQDSATGPGIGNSVGTVIQTYTGSGGTDDENFMQITQTGHNNQVGTARENGANNKLVITQTGNNNTIVNASIIGDNNGTGDFTQPLALLLSSREGLQSGVITQDGTNNSVDLSITNDANQFGVIQRGNNNTAGNIAISGSDNQFGLVQDGGNNNALTLSTISGDTNDVAVYQWGNTNASMVSVFGSNNHAGTLQSGNTNDATLWLSGGDNDAGIVQEGNNNIASVTAGAGGGVEGHNVTGAVQAGNYNEADISIHGAYNVVAGFQAESSGSAAHHNVMTVSVTGSGNNQMLDWNTAPSFGTNAAGTLAGDSDTPSISELLSLSGFDYPDYAPPGLEAAIGSQTGLMPGAMVQVGHENSLSLTVSSSDSKFGTLQAGNNNEITGTISGVGSSSNVAAVLQFGNSNSATFTQNGSNNVAAISQ